MIHWQRAVSIAAVVAASLLTAPAVSGQSNSLATGYVWDSGWCAGPFMDITAAAPLTITRFDMYFKGTLNRNVSVYYKVGTYVGSETTSGAWTLIGTVNVTPAGDGIATQVNLGGVSIPSGQTYGFHVWDGLGTGGTDGGGLILDANAPPHSNAQMTLTSNAYTCDGPFTGVNPGFGWEGTVYYSYGAPEAIPALGTKALAGLAALVLLLGWIMLRQRSAA